MLYLYFGFLATMSVLEYILMVTDKHLARKHKRRISEKTLLLTAALGGALGGLLAMYAVRHKTKHWYFVLWMPLFTVLYAILSYFVMINF